MALRQSGFYFIVIFSILNLTSAVPLFSEVLVSTTQLTSTNISSNITEPAGMNITEMDSMNITKIPVTNETSVVNINTTSEAGTNNTDTEPVNSVNATSGMNATDAMPVNITEIVATAENTTATNGTVDVALNNTNETYSNLTATNLIPTTQIALTQENIVRLKRASNDSAVPSNEPVSVVTESRLPDEQKDSEKSPGEEIQQISENITTKSESIGTQPPLKKDVPQENATTNTENQAETASPNGIAEVSPQTWSSQYKKNIFIVSTCLGIFLLAALFAEKINNTLF